jgi:hypothetical protein
MMILIDHSYRGEMSPVNFATLTFEYVTLEFGTSRLILEGSPVSGPHGPRLAPGFVDPLG